MGCQAYDANTSNGNANCQTNSEAYCLNQWCYVDMTLCPVNAAECAAAGALEGSDDSPYCRTRPHAATTTGTNMSVYYSYETCGYMNTYDLNGLFSDFGGTTMKTAVSAFGSWVLSRTNAQGEQVFGGALYDVFVEALTFISPSPVMTIIPGWSTPGSRALFPSSSYTACVHDVAIGVFDVCVGDLWLTPERQQLATFSPALRHDYFYLVVPAQLEDVSIWSRLSRPFLPFTPGAWGVVAGFLCGISVLLYLIQCYEKGCPRPTGKGLGGQVVQLGRSFFLIWHDFLLGQSTIVEVERGPALKFLSLSFSFFVLVTLASYTASLASMLVVQRQAVGTIDSIEEAISQDISICLHPVLVETFSKVYPRATFVPTSQGACPRGIHSGACGAMILAQDFIDRLHAGILQEDDCQQVADGSLTEAEAHCQTDANGNPRNDCDFIKVGSLLWTIPIAYPLSSRALRSISYALTGALSQGKMQEAQKLNADAFPSPQCEAASAQERSEMDGLEIGDISGTIVLALFIAGVGLVCCAGQACARRYGPKEEEEEEEGTAAALEEGQEVEGKVVEGNVVEGGVEEKIL